MSTNAQLSLFPEPIPFPPFVYTSATSYEAAEKVGRKTPSQRERIWAFIASEGEHGATREEIERELGLSGNTVRPRVAELLKVGRIRVAQETRRTVAGLRAEVLIASR